MYNLNRQDGAVAPLVAVLLFVIVICVALVVDLGHVHNVKIELQRTVDAAALAGTRYLPDETAAENVATTTAGQNRVDGSSFQDLLDNAEATLDVVFGDWNPNLTDPDTGTVLTVEERFDETALTSDAVYVRATRNVDHVFFFFTEDTLVTADAIAVQEPINPVLPLAIVSCIPLDKIQGNPGEYPGTTPCDIGFYQFGSDLDDTGAWTSLTMQHGVNEIVEIIEDPDQRGAFEQIVFGLNLGNNGIENTTPQAGTLDSLPPAECNHPMELDIKCGLGGKIGGKDIAAPEEFPPPSGVPTTPVTMPTDANGIYQPYSASFDPMFAYANNGFLPRWYNFTSDGTFKTDDHFLRVWSQDGFLLKGTGETFREYQTRLQSYFEGATAPPDPFNDGRFTSPDYTDANGVTGKGFIRGPGSNALGNDEKIAISDYYNSQSPAPSPPLDKAEVVYFPDFMKIMQHAGYPQVGVTNGNAASVLDAFFGLPEIADGSDLQCSDNPPLDTGSDATYGGETFRLQVPVIFAGFCESWKALSVNKNHTLVYIGLADFLMTRGWKSNNSYYACPGPDYVNVSSSSCPDPFYPPDGGGADYPPVPADGNLSLEQDNIKGIEGLVKLPRVDDAFAQSTVRVFLVE